MSSAVYAGTEAALLGFSRAIATEVAEDNITVNSIAPGRIDTPILNSSSSSHAANVAYLERSPIKRLGQSMDIALLSLFLASNAASYMTGAVFP